MKGVIVAPVKRVLRGHSDRSLVHAIEEAGLESKIEVPSDAVRDVVPGQEYVLVLSWTLEPVVSSTSPSGPTAAPAPTPLPTTVDEEFMALMARPRGPRRSPSAGPAQAVPASPTTAGATAPPTAGPTPPTPTGSAPPTSGAPTTSVAEQLAQRLGIRSSSHTG